MVGMNLLEIRICWRKRYINGESFHEAKSAILSKNTLQTIRVASILETGPPGSHVGTPLLEILEANINCDRAKFLGAFLGNLPRFLITQPHCIYMHHLFVTISIKITPKN
jgi:hypothetical protein